jgi:hypothetical protein
MLLIVLKNSMGGNIPLTKDAAIALNKEAAHEYQV